MGFKKKVLIILLVIVLIVVVYSVIGMGQNSTISFNDGGTSYNKSTDWIVSNKTAVHISDYGTTINNTSPNKVVYFAHSDSFWAERPLYVEFDVVDLVGDPFIHIYDGKSSFIGNLSEANGTHVKLQIDDDLSWSIDGKMQKPFKQNMGKSYIRFVVPANDSFTYKNFKISSL